MRLPPAPSPPHLSPPRPQVPALGPVLYLPRQQLCLLLCGFFISRRFFSFLFFFFTFIFLELDFFLFAFVLSFSPSP